MTILRCRLAIALWRIAPRVPALARAAGTAYAVLYTREKLT